MSRRTSTGISIGMSESYARFLHPFSLLEWRGVIGRHFPSPVQVQVRTSCVVIYDRVRASSCFVACRLSLVLSSTQYPSRQLDANEGESWGWTFVSDDWTIEISKYVYCRLIVIKLLHSFSHQTPCYEFRGRTFDQFSLGLFDYNRSFVFSTPTKFSGHINASALPCINFL